MNRMKEVDPVLKWFGKKCRAKLAQPQNQRKSSWREMTFPQLMKRLREEVSELHDETKLYREYLGLSNAESATIQFRQNVIDEAADVANFAMMIADKARKSREHMKT